MYYDIIVVGGGPAGMIAAGKAASLGKKVLLIEKNEKLGKKLYITGKGRCNVTNSIEINDFFNYIPKNSKFLYSSFMNFSNTELISFFEQNGIKLKEERGGRVFPVSDKSSDIIRALQNYLKDNGVDIFLNTKVKKIIKDVNKISGVLTEDDKTYNCNSIIICTGGLSYPQTGSTGDGYEMAKQVGHSVTEVFPSLVPLVVKEIFIKDLQGLSLKNVSVEVSHNNKIIYKDFGELLFTHFGLSGPIILSASFFVSDYIRKKQSVSLSIDLKPALNMEELNNRLLNDFEKNQNKQLKNSLDELLPKKIIPVIISLSKIPENKAVHQITKEERKILIEIIKNLNFTIIDTRPISEAIITSGGINLKEINPKTMESKLVSGLYFAGEILDLDAFTGGFNLQIAFSTGYTAGINA